jgi:branched-chain amino acid transport system substrate-binding protein
VLTATDESFLQQIGKIVEGVMSVNAWSPALDTPESASFVVKAMKMTGRPVTTPMMDAYVGGKWALKAIEKVNGKVEDKAAFMKALRSVKLASTPHGPLSLDKYGCPVQNMYVRKVEKKGDKYQNSVIYTYKGVSQFWKYDPEKYLKEPPYGKNFPPCKHCN